MARGVDQIQAIDLTITRLVAQGRGLRLDGDATLTLQRHRIEHLGFHLAFGQTTTELNDAVSQSRFAVIDVGDDGKIAYQLHGHAGLMRLEPLAE